MKSPPFLSCFKTYALALSALLTAQVSSAADRPHIVWIFVEDTNNWMGCYGDSTVPTPNIDRLAENGTRFDRAYMSAGVCSATRSAIALGAMQTSLGVHNHRSSRQRVPGESFRLPEDVKTIYQLMRRNGYYVVNQGPKNDFNFLWPSRNEKELARVAESAYGTGAYREGNPENLLYDVNGNTWASSPGDLDFWKDRPRDKPLFLQFQLAGGKNNGKFVGATPPAGNTPVKAGKKMVYRGLDEVEVMPYYPDLPSVRAEIAHHYDTIRQTDDEVGRIVATLKKEGIYDDAIIFFWTDHGMLLPRHKQWLYEGGINVPLIVAGPGIAKGQSRQDLVSGIDITATTLSLSGTKAAKHMEGLDMFSKDYSRDFVVSARDRCDFTIERVRAVTTKRFKYIRNFLTDRPFMQPQYRDSSDYVKDMKAYYEAGKMNETQKSMWAERRPPEEFYDLENDPHEIRNLAGNPKYAAELAEHRNFLSDWIAETDDKGQYPETVIALKGALKQWPVEAVNPEYDKAR